MASKVTPENSAQRVLICAAGELWGGVERFVEVSAVALSQRGLIPTVALFHHGELEARIRSLGISVDVTRTRGPWDPGAIPALRHLVSRHRAHVIHTHGYRAALLGGLAVLRSGCAMVHTFHGLQEPARGLENLKLAAFSRLEILAARHLAEQAIAVSAELFRRLELERWGERAHLIHNGLTPFALPEPFPTCELPDAGQASFRIGVVGRVDAVKGHLTLLKAVAALDPLTDVALYVLGEGPLLTDCKKVAAELGIARNVHFVGFQREVYRWLRSLDVFAMPSWHEGLPYSLLEALYVGVPVVTTAVGGILEVVTDGVSALLVPAGDAAALASALTRLRRDGALRSRLSVEGRRVVEARFMVDVTMDAYERVYETAVAQRRVRDE